MNVPDDRLFDRGAHPGLAPPADRFVVVYHGLLAERGGVDLLVKAVAALRDEIPGLELRIAGWGPLEPRLRQIAAEAQLNGTVRFLGKVAWDDIPAILLQAHLGCVPNRPDLLNRYALNNKILECVAMGLPVAASRSEALDHYFTDDQIAFLVPGDFDGLVRMLRELAGDPARRARLAAASARFHEEHRWSVQARELATALERLAGSGVA
jgi:glycosyltransferase involved in cell wall biosynthesis